MRRGIHKWHLMAILVLDLVVLGAIAWAQTAPAPPVVAPAMDWNALLMPLIIAAIPVIVYFAKKLIPAKYSVFYPVLATVLGPALDYVTSWIAQHPARPGLGIALGLAAVGLREVVDQLKKAPASISAPS